MIILAGPGLYSCSCNCGWIGTNCNSAVDRCASSPCQNGGLCQNTAPCGFQCICSLGFSGSLCQTYSNPCSSNPCSINGQCVNSYFGYTCNCSAGYTGSGCNTPINVLETLFYHLNCF